VRIIIRLFSRRWLLTTLLVLAATGVLIRLGIWQLDRLQTRRAYNAQVVSQVNKPVLKLDADGLSSGNIQPENLSEMEYRKVVVSGEYDPSQEVALRNQVWHDQYGVHLLTPLHIKDSNIVVIVDRGWIPGGDFSAGESIGAWPQFMEPGQVTVYGVIRRQQTKPDLGRISDPTPFPGQGRITAWNLSNLEQMQRQLPYPILPVYIQQSPDPAWTKMPYRSEPELDLTEGPHMGYALQWFSFAAILIVGYPFYVRRDVLRSEKESVKKLQESAQYSGD